MKKSIVYGDTSFHSLVPVYTLTGSGREGAVVSGATCVLLGKNLNAGPRTAASWV